MKSSVGDTFTMPNPEHVLVKVAVKEFFMQILERLVQMLQFL